MFLGISVILKDYDSRALRSFWVLSVRLANAILPRSLWKVSVYIRVYVCDKFFFFYGVYLLLKLFLYLHFVLNCFLTF